MTNQEPISRLDRARPDRHDLEQLSAYLDGELESVETARLEARLLEDEGLRLELQELRATAQMLGMLPQVRLPRNFTLSAAARPRRAGASTSLRPRRALRLAQGGEQRRTARSSRAGHSASLRAGYPLLQLGTAVATLGFLIVVGADVLLSRSFAAAPVAESLRAAELEEMPAEEAAKAEPALEADAQATAAPLALEAKVQITGTPQAPEAGAIAAPTEAAAAEGQLEVTASALSPTAEQEAGAYADAYRARDEEQVGEVGTQPPEDEALAQASLPEAEPTGPDQAPGPPDFRGAQPLLRTAELGLGVAAVVLAGFTLWVRRRP